MVVDVASELIEHGRCPKAQLSGRRRIELAGGRKPE
jgi:hypothetical protein